MSSCRRRLILYNARARAFVSSDPKRCALAARTSVMSKALRVCAADQSVRLLASHSRNPSSSLRAIVRRVSSPSVSAYSATSARTSLLRTENRSTLLRFECIEATENCTCPPVDASRRPSTSVIFGRARAIDRRTDSEYCRSASMDRAIKLGKQPTYAAATAAAEMIATQYTSVTGIPGSSSPI